MYVVKERREGCLFQTVPLPAAGEVKCFEGDLTVPSLLKAKLGLEKEDVKSLYEQFAVVVFGRARQTLVGGGWLCIALRLHC
jgi:hypothetical protein